MAKHSNPKCKTCLYRAREYENNGCNYIEIVGHSRGCSVQECDKYVNAARKRRQKQIVYSTNTGGK